LIADFRFILAKNKIPKIVFSLLLNKDSLLNCAVTNNFGDPVVLKANSYKG